MQSSLVVVLALALTAPVTSFNTPVVLRNRQGTVAPLSSTCRAPGTRMQLADPDGPIKIPDTFNPAEWTRRTGGGDSGVGGGLGGFRVPDSFNPDAYQMEKEKGRSATAVLERPKLDPGKKYKVLLFNDEKNTREYVIDTLIKVIPGMSGPKAKEITAEAHNNGMAIVGIWMFELAEAYSDLLRAAGLRSDVEQE